MSVTQEAEKIVDAVNGLLDTGVTADQLLYALIIVSVQQRGEDETADILADMLDRAAQNQITTNDNFNSNGQLN